MRQIKILILTERERCEYWVNKYKSIFRQLDQKRTYNGVILSNEFIFIELTYSINENRRGAAWSFCIIDTEISHQTFHDIIYPTVKYHYDRTQHGIIKYE